MFDDVAIHLCASCQVRIILSETSRCEVKITIAKDGFPGRHFRDSRNTGGNSFPLQKSVIVIAGAGLGYEESIRCYLYTVYQKKKQFISLLAIFGEMFNVKTWH